MLRDQFSEVFEEPDIPDPPNFPSGIDYDRWTHIVKPTPRRIMSSRSEHKFEFKASEIATAAAEARMYHEERLKHWQARSDDALATVEGTIGAKVVRRQQTNGDAADVIVDYGDPDAWREYQLAFGKVRTHRQAAERYQTDERVYGTQGDRPYDLDTDDVHHFHLGGQGREE